MIINASSLRDLYVGLNTSFNKGFAKAPSHWEKVAMKTTSKTGSEKYTWLTDFPGIREWIGDRVVHDLAAARFEIENRDFELTYKVKRNDVEDDNLGTYGKPFENMGYETAMHPDDLVFSLLRKGNVLRCYDGQYFFDTDHPNFNADGEVISVTNYTDGANPAWYMVDGSKPLMPMIYQERKPFQFVSYTDGSHNDFWRKEYIYGTDGRSNAGFGLWQLAYCSKAELNSANFVAAKTTMTSYRRASGKPLGIAPTHMIVPPTLEEKARQLLNATLINGGESNVWANSVDLVVSPFLG